MILSQRGSATVWIVIIATFAAVIGGLIWLSAGNSGSGTSSLPLDRVADSDHLTAGSRDARVVLIEYSDFQCPACGAYAPILKQLESEYGDRVAFVFRHFPLRSIHLNAEPAARAAEAAARQDAFVEMRDKLYDTQAAWSNLTDPTATFKGYAEELGLNLETFASDYSSAAVREKIDGDVDSGRGAGVTGTPTFYLNGTKLSNPNSVEAFRRLLDEAIAKNPVVNLNGNSNSNANAN